jgi:hypothetical protein
MGQGSAETVKEIEETRDRLEQDLRELEERMPQPAVWAKRAVGILVGGGTAVTVGLFLLKRRSKKRKEAAARQAAVVQPIIQVLPEGLANRMSERLEDGTWKPYAAGAAGLYVVFRLAEIRQLRRTNKLLLATRAA